MPDALPAAAMPSGPWFCPACRGLGHHADGSLAFSPGTRPGRRDATLTPHTPCRLCRGKGRVLVLPLPDEGVAP